MFETYMAYVLMLAAYGETRASLFLNQCSLSRSPTAPPTPPARDHRGGGAPRLRRAAGGTGGSPYCGDLGQRAGAARGACWLRPGRARAPCLAGCYLGRPSSPCCVLHHSGDNPVLEPEAVKGDINRLLNEQEPPPKGFYSAAKPETRSSTATASLSASGSTGPRTSRSSGQDGSASGRGTSSSRSRSRWTPAQALAHPQVQAGLRARGISARQ